MQLSITTDYQGDTGCPEASLRAIAAAGFTHVHWCHQWNTDFVYTEPEIRQIAAWLRETGLKLLDLHGSAGKEKCWWSTREYERLAGVELVRNRLRMTAELGGATVVMHSQSLPPGADTSPHAQQTFRSLDELLPTIRQTGVRLAIENMASDDFRFLNQLLARYAPEDVGICYDCGHGNMAGGRGLDYLEPVKDRLIAVHLHDNDGTGDQHHVPFTGTVDWPRLACILAASSYRGCISMESNVWHVPEPDRPRFLTDALAAGERLTALVKKKASLEGEAVKDCCR